MGFIPHTNSNQPVEVLGCFVMKDFLATPELSKKKCQDDWSGLPWVQWVYSRHAHTAIPNLKIKESSGKGGKAFNWRLFTEQ